VENLETLKILVTGGTGFVGSNLVRFFYKIGHEVATTMREGSNDWRISDISNDIKQFKVDLTDAQKVKSALTSFKPNIVINTAAYGGYHFETDRERIFDVNFNATINLVESYLQSESELLINTGSSSEYGFKTRPMSENDLIEPVGAYAVSKAAATLYGRSRSIETNRKITTFRLFSAYGDYEEAHRLIPYLMISAIKREKAQMNNPDNVRDFIYIEDICNAYNELIKRRNQTALGEIFNLGSGKQSGVGEIVYLVEKLSGEKVNVDWQYKRERIGDKASRWVADMFKTYSLLNWKPRYSLEEGLSKTYDWFKENVSKYEVIENSKLRRSCK
jgi:dolichol-phosphate mannosyltransferase